MVLCGLFCVVGEPLLLGGAFLGLLLNRAIWLGINRGFIGLVLFIVYVGGTIVLFTYCLMLSPLQFFSKQKKYYRVVLVVLRGIVLTVGSIGIYEFFAFLGGSSHNWYITLYRNVKSSGVDRLFPRFSP